MLPSVLLTTLPSLLQAQPILNLPDLVDVGEQLVVADKVPVDDHGGHGDSSQASTVPLECHGSGGEWTEKLIKLMLSSGRHIGKFFVNE